MDMQSKQAIAFEKYTPTSATFVERMFGIVLTISLSVMIMSGMYLRTVKVIPASLLTESAPAINANLLLDEEINTKVKKSQTQKPSPPVSKPAIDLTKKPELGQKADGVAEGANRGIVRRRVFGLRRVHSIGIGQQGEMEDAIVGKLGNSLDVPVDTITATKQDLQGALAPITTVTKAPISKYTEKPLYIKEMIDAKVEGTIRAQLLVDVDGKVKDIKILNDLGFGTLEAARTAFLRWIFDPARKGNEPVAVWISCSIRFVLLQ